MIASSVGWRKLCFTFRYHVCVCMCFKCLSREKKWKIDRCRYRDIARDIKQRKERARERIRGPKKWETNGRTEFQFVASYSYERCWHLQFALMKWWNHLIRFSHTPNKLRSYSLRTICFPSYGVRFLNLILIQFYFVFLSLCFFFEIRFEFQFIGQRAYIESLVANNATIREGKRLRIVCKVQGHPPPKVVWRKDNRSIAKNRSRYQFIHLR